MFQDVQLNQVIATMNLDAGTVRTVTEKVDNILKEKNDVINQLQFELSRVKKVSNQNNVL